MFNLDSNQFFNRWTLILTLTLILFHPQSGHSEKILVLYPIAPSSHYFTVSVLSDELIRRGHTIHVVQWKEHGKSQNVGYSVPVTNPATNFTTHVTTLAMDGRDGRFFVLSKEKEAGFTTPTKLFWEPGLSSAAILLRPEWTNYFSFLEAQCDTLLSNQKLIHKLRSEHFDVAIIDMSWNECSIALAHALQIKPVIGFWLSTVSSLEPDLSTTTFLSSSSHVSIFRTKLAPTTFVDRMYNILAKFASQLIMWIYFYHIDRSISRHLPKLERNAYELEKSLDGMLINDHLALGIPRALPPNYLNVGGLQIGEGEASPLDHEIESWLNEAPHGVIFFSFGSRLGLSGAPEFIRKTFLQALQRIPQRILLQFDNLSVEHELRMNGSISDNVKTFHWISQQSVLAHPNIQLFITHGGQQSALESIYAEIPMIVFPVVHDAPETSSKLVAKGVAVELDRYYVTVDEIVTAINRVLRDPSYKKNVKAMSRIMRYEINSTNSPLHRAADFLEYLITQNGAPHLKVPDANLTIVQYCYLDILLFLMLMIGCVYMVGIRIRSCAGIGRLLRVHVLHVQCAQLFKKKTGSRVTPTVREKVE